MALTIALAAALLLAGCTAVRDRPAPPSPPPAATRPSEPPPATPLPEPSPPASVSKPAAGYLRTGRASWYGRAHEGRMTASGERFDADAMTAAHRTLPFGTWLLVENLANGRTVKVRVNDRGPMVRGRVLDLSHAAARALGVTGEGVFEVRYRVLDRD